MGQRSIYNIPSRNREVIITAGNFAVAMTPELAKQVVQDFSVVIYSQHEKFDPKQFLNPERYHPTVFKTTAVILKEVAENILATQQTAVETGASADTEAKTDDDDRAGAGVETWYRSYIWC